MCASTSFDAVSDLSDLPGGSGLPMVLMSPVPPAAEMLALVATHRCATLCASGGGTTRLIQTIRYGSCIRADGRPDHARCAVVARELMTILEVGALRSRADRVIILAAAPLYYELCRIRTIRSCDFLVAQIETPSTCQFPRLEHKTPS